MRLDVADRVALPLVEAQGLDGKVSIPDLLRAVPQARAVLDRYGLRGCGGRLGPVESLEFFARAHDVPLNRLLDELRQCVQGAAPPAGHADACCEARREDAIYRPFFKAGILVVLSLGAVWGAYLLLRIGFGGSFAQAGLHEVNAHGHAQIFGWVGLFVMGFAYQAFPRFKHASLARPRLAWLSLGLMLVGLVGRSVAEPLAAALPWAGPVAVAAAWLEMAAIAAFVWVILATWRAAGKGLAFYDYYILAALGWFVVQAVFEALYLGATLAAGSREELLALVKTWQGALRETQIHGFALLMILGVSQRILHSFYGLPAPGRRLSLVLLACLNVAVAGEAVGLVLIGRVMAGTADKAWAGQWYALWYASALLLTGSVVAWAWNCGVFGKVSASDRSLKFIRAAYVWLLVSLAMLVLLPAYLAAAGFTFSHAYYGAIRHAITVGFVSLMIVGVASKVVPTLNGVDAARLTPLWGPFLLLNAGCALRVLAQTLTDFIPPAFPVAGVSGLLEVTGLALWGAHLWSVMAGCPRLRGAAAEEEPYTPGSPITAAHRVGELLDAQPALLDTFLTLGFRPLANPLLRRTVARRVTVGQASRHLGRDEQEVLAALNRAVGLPVKQTLSLPVLSNP
jgi:hypothetical protein